MRELDHASCLWAGMAHGAFQMISGIPEIEPFLVEIAVFTRLE